MYAEGRKRVSLTKFVRRMVTLFVKNKARLLLLRSRVEKLEAVPYKFQKEL